MSARATGSYDTSRLFALNLVYHCALRLDGPRHRPSRTAYLQIVCRCARWRPPEKMNDTQRPTSSHRKEQWGTWSARVILRLPLCTAVAVSSVLLAQRQLNTVTGGNQKDKKSPQFRSIRHNVHQAVVPRTCTRMEHYVSTFQCTNPKSTQDKERNPQDTRRMLSASPKKPDRQEALNECRDH